MNDRSPGRAGGGGRADPSRRAARRPSRSRTLFAEPRKEPEANASIAVRHGPLMLAFCLGGSPCNTLPRGEPPLMQPEQLGSSDFDKAFPDKPRGRLPYSPLCCHFADSSQIRYLTQSLILQVTQPDGNTIDAPFRRVQNQLFRKTSFGGNADGSEIPREFPVFPCSIAAQAWRTFITPRQ